MKLKYLLRIAGIGAVLYASVVYMGGITVTDIGYGVIPSYALVFVTFVIVELLLYPVIKMFILPLRIITFGLASAVLSINLVYVIALILPFFSVASFWQGALIGLALGLVRLLTK